MERQEQGTLELPPFVERLRNEGKREGVREGKAEGVREVLFKFIARAGISLSEEERARIEACRDPATLDRWVDNAFTAKTAADLFR